MMWTAYGPPDVLKMGEIEKPTPRSGEIVVRVHSTTVTAGDTEIRSMKVPFPYGPFLRAYAGLIKPTRVRVLGTELSGVVDSIGEGVERFKPGDEVFGNTGFAFGANAEYVRLPGDAPIDHKPPNLSFEEAAAVSIGGFEAVHFTRATRIGPGQHVLINGAGGCIGTFSLQLAKLKGARVTCVDSAEKLEMLSSLGADGVLDYQKEDFTRIGETYDVIFDVVGKSPFLRSLKVLQKGGTYHIANPKVRHKFLGPLALLFAGKRVFSRVADYRIEDLVYLKDLLQRGKLKVIIDRTYPLERLPEAHRYVESGKKKGNVVINIGNLHEPAIDGGSQQGLEDPAWAGPPNPK